MEFSIKTKIKAYMDLLRIHFSPVWPLLFCTGLMLAFRNYGGFSWSLLIRAALIGFFGFEAGMVLNDILDRNVDQLEPDDKMTNYWRPFKKRPIPNGLVSIKEALVIFGFFILITIGLIATLPFPHMLYVYGIMIYAYVVESFYNIKKRNQKIPIAQLLGRTDLTVFPVAGYLCYGEIDWTVLLLMAFIYPWAIAHLATNDIADIVNDEAKELKTITILYGLEGSVTWVVTFTTLHLVTAFILLIVGKLSFIALGGILAAEIIIIIANVFLIVKKNSRAGMTALPMFHASLLVYTITIILDSTLMFNYPIVV
jgi:4-hydroxybenzoate polyprenyltransferase